MDIQITNLVGPLPVVALANNYRSVRVLIGDVLLILNRKEAEQLRAQLNSGFERIEKMERKPE